MKVLILLVILQTVMPMPISVPVDNNFYPDAQDRRPNSHYNRLPNRIPVQTDDASNNGVTDEYDDDDDDDDSYQQTDRPVTNGQFSNGYYSQILTENKIKRRRRKKIKRPCIPIQSLGSPLFNNRLKRDVEDKESGKTLGLLGLLGGYGAPYYGYPQPTYGGNFPGANFAGYPNGGNRPFFDNVKPESDTGLSSSSNFANYGPAQYNPIGGYPCIPVSQGHIPHGGPLGFFGNGGLFDYGGGHSPTSNYPQTVIINRPPLFGNRPFYDRPGVGGGISSGGSGGVESDASRPGFWGSIVDKLQEFVGFNI
jgi:hypothetical protein